MTACRNTAPPQQTERVKGIEPSFSAWEAEVLPLNYTRASADSTAQSQ